MPDLGDLPGGDVKIGGKSIYLYAAVIGAVAVIYMWWSGRGQVQETANAVQTVGVPDVSGDLGDLPKAAAEPVDVVVADPTNAEWMAKSIAYLVTTGVSPLAAQVALQKYFDGEQLDYKQTLIVNAAVGKYGIPPQGLYGPPQITESQPDTTPAATTPAPTVAKPAAKAAPRYVNHDAKYVVAQGKVTFFDAPGGKAIGTLNKGDTVTTTVKYKSLTTLWVGTQGGRWFRESALKKA